VLSEESLDEYLPDWKEKKHQPPTWVEPIKEKGTVFAHDIGLLKGLFWQPGHVELVKLENSGQCSCCGHNAERLFTEFNKAKFNYTIEGIWIHPHSPQVLSVKKGEAETRYVGFTQSIPAWTQLSRYVVKRDLSDVDKGEQGQKPALVIQQIRRYIPKHADKFELLIGGYRNNQAAIIERRHEVLTLNHGWENHADTVHEVVAHGLKYKTALRKVLYVCSKGIKEKERKLKGTGLDLHEVGETRFYRRSEDLMTHALADIDFDNPVPTFMLMDQEFKQICEAVFSELTSPYEHDPELFRTLAIARRSLQRHIKEICLQQADEDAA
jgi:CRISPR system Cascade subunit CasA